VLLRCLVLRLAPLVLIGDGTADRVRGGGRERQADGSRHGFMVSVGRR
jgi:hypothetical protein